MKILAIDFSSPQMSVAVAAGENASKATVLSEVIETGTRAGSALGMVEAVLHDGRVEREKIECLVIGLGPGSYNGIRTSIALAQGWQLARPIKLLGISSAECVAAEAQAGEIFGRVGVVIDAQRNEFYLATWDINETTRSEIEPLRLASLDDLKKQQQAEEIVIGPEIKKWFPDGRIVFPRAATLAQLAFERSDYLSGEKLQPIYLRETSFVKAPPPRIFPE